MIMKLDTVNLELDDEVRDNLEKLYSQLMLQPVVFTMGDVYTVNNIFLSSV